MKNFVQDAETIEVPAPYDVASGGAFLVGALFAVALATAKSGDLVQGKRRGAIMLPKATGAAWAIGDKLYWDNTNKVLTKTASGNTLVGAALAVAASGDTNGLALLTGQIA
ncbi:DUF2190 family protein [Sphingobium sp. B11D3A]|uniref:DUF2190 family protein n=1 Tax=Sphingobium sp. B11D3A TaxID=2940574 RepID=UPI0022258979|nr:DUF2190 family protein [Sphingobium sp. B11D3A]MCW2390968.1 putative RecA/RadA family phage recombinase [Sphingobium sp. B11D3A]